MECHKVQCWEAVRCLLDLVSWQQAGTRHLTLEALCPHVRESETLSADTLTSGGYVTVQVEGTREDEAHKGFGEPQMDHLPTGKQVENPCFRVYKDTSILSHMAALCCHSGTCSGCSHHTNTGIPTGYSSLQYRQNLNALFIKYMMYLSKVEKNASVHSKESWSVKRIVCVTLNSDGYGLCRSWLNTEFYTLVEKVI